MILRFALLLITKIRPLDFLMEKFVSAYFSFKKLGEICIEDHRDFLKVKCDEDLAKVVAFEKYGNASGYPAPKKYKKG